MASVDINVGESVHLCIAYIYIYISKERAVMRIYMVLEALKLNK